MGKSVWLISSRYVCFDFRMSIFISFFRGDVLQISLQISFFSPTRWIRERVLVGRLGRRARVIVSLVLLVLGYEELHCELN